MASLAPSPTFLAKNKVDHCLGPVAVPACSFACKAQFFFPVVALQCYVDVTIHRLLSSSSLYLCMTASVALVFWQTIQAADLGNLSREHDVLWFALTLAFLHYHSLERVWRCYHTGLFSVCLRQIHDVRVPSTHLPYTFRRFTVYGEKGLPWTCPQYCWGQK